jgi:hypothetical protein
VVILHAFLALAAGFATIALLGIGLKALMAKLIPSWAAEESEPEFSSAFVHLGASLLSALQSKGRQPIWFQLAQVAVSPLGVLAGGLLRLRVMGIL